MKVKELIEQLQQCDPEAMVVSRGYEHYNIASFFQLHLQF